MRVLIVSNAPWTKTGYGTQGASLARRLQADGHNVAYMCNYGLNGGNVTWNGIPCLTNGLEGGYADPIVHGHIRSTQPDLVITLFDIWALRGQDFPLPLEYEHMAPRWAAWFPIDTQEVGEATLDVARRVTYPITMSRHGHEEINRHNIANTYIPHGVEKDFYFTTAGRREFRRVQLLPDDAVLFGSVGLNRNYPNRKGLDRLIMAFAKLPKNAYLYLHTLPNSQAGSIDLRGIAELYGVEDRVRYADPYNYIVGYSQEGMNAIYSAIDCYVQPTMGEGFGLPVLEAQACGCPVIATDCTSMPELVSPNTSELVKGTPFFVPDYATRTLVDIDDLAEKMRGFYDIYYNDHDGYVSMRANAGKWANNWDWDTLWEEQWRPWLAAVQRDVERSPTKKYHRGRGIVVINDDHVHKQDSSLRSPAVHKELLFIQQHQDVKGVIPILRSGVDETDGTTWFDTPRMTPLRDVDLSTLNEQDKQRILTGVADTLNALHSRGVAHRDVCPENVVLDEEGNPFLIDFEWSAQCDGEACVDFEPWLNPSHTIPIVQTGIAQRGYHTLVNYIRELNLDEKAHGWKGIPYQAVDGVGERDCQTRWDLMAPDVKGKCVLDVGCNLGWFVRKSVEEGAWWAWGLDFDTSVLEAADKLTVPDSPTYYRATDLDDPQGLDVADLGHFDVAFCLSVLQHLKDPDAVLRRLQEIADEIYIEQPPRMVTDYMNDVLSEAEYIGESERGRPIWRLKVKVPA